MANDHRVAWKEIQAMTKHITGTRKEWLAARLELLEAEKEITRMLGITLTPPVP